MNLKELLMEKKSIAKEISLLTEQIKDQFDGIRTNKDASDAEVQTFLNLVEKLHEKAIVFNFLNQFFEDNQEESQSNGNSSSSFDLFSEYPDESNLLIRESKSKAIKKTKRLQLDLKDLINENDKFLFINELFEGSTKEFIIAINQLENIDETTEAYRYVDSLKDIYRWEESNNAFKKFLLLLEKKFR